MFSPYLSLALCRVLGASLHWCKRVSPIPLLYLLVFSSPTSLTWTIRNIYTTSSCFEIYETKLEDRNKNTSIWWQQQRLWQGWDWTLLRQKLLMCRPSFVGTCFVLMNPCNRNLFTTISYQIAKILAKDSFTLHNFQSRIKKSRNLWLSTVSFFNCDFEEIRVSTYTVKKIV